MWNYNKSRISQSLMILSNNKRTSPRRIPLCSIQPKRDYFKTAYLLNHPKQQTRAQYLINPTKKTYRKNVSISKRQTARMA